MSKSLFSVLVKGAVYGLIAYGIFFILPFYFSQKHLSFSSRENILRAFLISGIQGKQFTLTELLVINSVIYLILGAVIALIYYLFISQIKMRPSQGIRRLGMSISIIPLIDLYANIFLKKTSLTTNLLSPQFPVPNIKGTVHNIFLYFHIDNPLPKFPLDTSFCLHILEVLLFTAMIVGLLNLRRWSYYLLLVVATYIVMNSVIFIFRYPGSFLILTIIYALSLCYFTILLVFFTNPTVRNQFYGIMPKVKTEDN